MTATLTPSAKQQFFDANGNPLAGGKLYTYTAGTTSPVVTYVDSAGVTTNTNPIILDSRGEANVWLGTGTFKFKLMSATDVEIWSVDNIPGAPTENAALVALAASNGSSLVGFIQSGTGAVATTVQTKLRETVSVKDFGAVGDGVTDDTAACKAAIEYAALAEMNVLFPSGYTYLISELGTRNVLGLTTGYALPLRSNVRIFGYGATINYNFVGGDPTRGFAIFSNLTDLSYGSPVEHFGVYGLTFNNTSGLGNVAQCIIEIIGGTNATSTNYVQDFQLHDLTSYYGGLFVYISNARTDSAFPVNRFSIKNLKHVNSRNSTFNGYGIEKFDVSGLIVENTDYDVSMLFQARRGNISNIVATGVQDNIVSVYCGIPGASQTTDSCSDINISNISSPDSGRIQVRTLGATQTISGINLSNVTVPTLQVVGYAVDKITDVVCSSTVLKPLSTLVRSLYCSLVSKLNLDVVIDGDCTAELAYIYKVKNSKLKVSSSQPAATVPHLRILTCSNLLVDHQAVGGGTGLYFNGAEGPTSNSEVRMNYSGLSSFAATTDGTFGVGYSVKLSGYVGGAQFNLSTNVADNFAVELAPGFGSPITLTLQVVSGYTNMNHAVTCSGASENFQRLAPGNMSQRITLFGTTGKTITVVSAGNGPAPTGGAVQNIFCKSYTNRTISDTAPITVEWMGSYWVEV
jgi:hypothetical protein